MLQFRDAPLGDVIAELNRYSQVQLRVDDEGLAGERLSGVFKAGDQELFLESLVLYLPVEGELHEDAILTIKGVRPKCLGLGMPGALIGFQAAHFRPTRFTIRSKPLREACSSSR